MPIDPDVRLAEGDHIVHFYEGSRDLARFVAGALAPRCRAHDPVIILATAEHRRAIRAALATAGVDVDEAITAGRLVVHDPATILPSILAGDRIDRDAFRALADDTVARVAELGRCVHVFGEVVGLLFEAGKVAAAMELEDLWSAIAAELPLTLSCAYPVQRFEAPACALDLAHVCDLHTHARAGRATILSAEASMTFPADDHAPASARRFLAETLTAWERDDLLDAGRLVVTELATNAVRHARAGFTLSLTRTADGVHLTVADVSGAPPERRALDPAAIGGRGLHLVDALSRRWGHIAHDHGKIVWAELAPAASTGAPR